jgi:hypothetical protein
MFVLSPSSNTIGLNAAILMEAKNGTEEMNHGCDCGKTTPMRVCPEWLQGACSCEAGNSQVSIDSEMNDGATSTTSTVLTGDANTQLNSLEIEP